ncbi:MAG: D-alanyl-D-alanine carboxypeptidase [Alphaproteobacteria bacterium]|nr:D-alanyl-D-alanine carboxypeptidase [Alphaproteobacteria bacterium]
MKIKNLILFFTILSFGINSFAISSKANYALLIDADTNEVLYQKNSKKRMAPSSMSKLMTTYVAFQQIKNGAIQLNDKVKVSKNAWSKGGSRMFLPLNKNVTIDNLLKGIIIQSGNDASIALAEAIAGSEEAFVARMNAVAKQIGLYNSHFTNSTGLPNENHYMTAEDLGILSQKIINDFPEYYDYFSQETFTYNRIKQRNRNVLISSHIGVDGLKTGHTNAAGYGIAASAKQGDRRLIAIVNGLNSENERARETQKLLQYGFLNFTNVVIARKNEEIASVKVQSGKSDTIGLVCEQNLVFTVPVEQKNQVQAVVNYQRELAAPIQKNRKVGIIEVKIPNKEPKKFDVCTKGDVLEAGLFSKMYSGAKSWIVNIGSSSSETDSDILSETIKPRIN